MKMFTNGSRLLSGMVLFAAISLASCSKDGGGDDDGPSINSISPSSALTGATITVTGKNLSESTILLGGIAGVVEDNTATSFTTRVPHLTVGQHEVVVSNDMGTARSSITVTGVGAPPVITSITPASVARGGTITISGTGLFDAVVEVATKLATVNTNTDNSITAVIPMNIADGHAAVRVTTMTGNVTQTITILP